MLIVYSPAEAFVKHLFALSELSEFNKEPHISRENSLQPLRNCFLLHFVAFSHDARDLQFEDAQLAVKRGRIPLWFEDGSRLLDTRACWKSNHFKTWRTCSTKFPLHQWNTQQAKEFALKLNAHQTVMPGQHINSPKAP